MSEEPAPVPAAAAPPASASKHVTSLTIRIWPNIPILYPMAIAALLCGIFSLMFGMDGVTKRLADTSLAAESGKTNLMQEVPRVSKETSTVAVHEVNSSLYKERVQAEQIIALCFLAVFAYTLVVVSTDMVLTWALLGVAIATIIGLVVFILNIYYGILSSMFSFVSAFVPVANAHFYFGIFCIWAILMVAGVIYARLHYVRIESNEVIVVGGVLDKRRRYSTMRMQYTKEICDVFEYYLPFVRSGRLILRFPNEEQPIIVDHVMGIDAVIKKLDHVAASLQVSSHAED